MSIILALKAKFFPKQHGPAEHTGGCPCDDIYNRALEAAQRNREAYEEGLDKVAGQITHEICEAITTKGHFVGTFYLRAGKIFTVVQRMKTTGELGWDGYFSLNKERIKYVREIIQDYFESQGFVTEYKEDEEGKFKYVRIALPDVIEEV